MRGFYCLKIMTYLHGYQIVQNLSIFSSCWNVPYTFPHSGLMELVPRFCRHFLLCGMFAIFQMDYCRSEASPSLKSQYIYLFK